MISRHRRRAIGLAVVVLVLLGAPEARAGEKQGAPWREGGPSRAEDLEIDVVTFGPGDRIVEWFGHSALVVRDTELDEERLYNYGLFSIDGDFALNFAMGRLHFWVGDAPVEPTLDLYRRNERDIRIQRLNLPPEWRRELAAFLAKNVLPENREYLYHHYMDNCSTRVRDAIDRVLGGGLERTFSRPSSSTFRDHVRRHMSHSPAVQFALLFLQSDYVDREIEIWDELFLPLELERALDEYEYEAPDGQKTALVESTEVYYDAEREPVPQTPPLQWPLYLAFGVFWGVLGLGIAIGLTARWRRILYGIYLETTALGLGGLGSVGFFLSFFTNHDVTYWNENLFLAHPGTLFVLAGLGVWSMIRESRGFWRWHSYGSSGLAGLALLGLTLKVLPAFDQHNVFGIAVVGPILLSLAATGWIRRRCY